MNPERVPELLSPALHSTVTRVLADAELAEQVIRETQAEYPHAAKKVWCVFKYLRTPPLLRGYAPFVFESHCRELCRRAAHREDLRPGTDAECLTAFMRTAQVAPLNREGSAITWYLFIRVVPESWRRDTFGGQEPAAEVWEGQIQEALPGIRKRVGDPKRVGD